MEKLSRVDFVREIKGVIKESHLSMDVNKLYLYNFGIRMTHLNHATDRMDKWTIHDEIFDNMMVIKGHKNFKT